MTLLPPSLRTGEPVVLPGAPRNFSVARDQEWALVEDGKLWKISSDPGSGPLFDADGKELAPDLQTTRSLTDATLLRGSASDKEVRTWAEEIQQIHPRTVCVFPAFLPQVRDLFVEPAVVISFPHGGDTTKSKLLQIEQALEDGAREIDVVAPLRMIAGSDWKGYAREMRQLVASGARLKLILETALYADAQIQRASQEALQAGVWCLKTSTGSEGGASPKAIRIMRDAGAKEIKASGGIRSRLQAGEMLGAGATMLGASNLEQWL